MNIDRKLEKRMPWYGDIGSHPQAAFLPHYSSGCCQNPSEIVCPYCGNKHEPWEMLTGEGDHEQLVECSACDLEFMVDASFGFGYTTKPKKCRTGHNYVFSSQYYYDGDHGRHGWVRIHNCTICGDMDYDRLTASPIAWRDQYNDPEFFDPDGILDTGLTLAEKISDRQSGPGTPVLDWLREVSERPKWAFDNLFAGMGESLARHDAIYSKVKP